MVFNRFFITNGLFLTIGLLFLWNTDSLKAQIVADGVNTANESQSNLQKRQDYLAQILKVLPEDRPGFGRVSYLDSTFGDWLKRTGELPPDFDQLPSIPQLPNPLVLEEGGRAIPIETEVQWIEKRQWMKEQLQHYISGTFPDNVGQVKSKILSERMDGEIKLQMVELRFGPEDRAKMTVELMIPPGDGPFPVFMSQWNHREWAQIAVRRGYIGCVYAGADSKDDTEEYSEIWAGEYDFTRLMRRAFGCSRVIDYLYTLAEVDIEKIALTGHSRNGKQSLMAAAFDDRIKAVVPSSGGTGAEVPWRYCSQKYDVEDIALLACAQPSWLHPRLRFFVGREDKLPIDQNHFMALIAPRGLMLSTAMNEVASNYWGIEKGYLNAKKVYEFRGVDNHLALRFREGRHSVTAEDIEAYIDFFDFVFKRSEKPIETTLVNHFDFDQWKQKAGISIDPLDYPIYHGNAIDVKKTMSTDDVKQRKDHLKQELLSILGKSPAGMTNYGPLTIANKGRGEDSFGHFLKRPSATDEMGLMPISPYSGFGDNLFGYLYYPKEKVANMEKLPVVIYLHEYDFSKGFTSMGFDHNIQSYFQDLVANGFAVMAFDMIGFGNRIKEGDHFYNRYPQWSKMGKMVADVQGAVDALVHMAEIDASQIYVSGFSLGATVGLFATALDDRIAGLVTVSGFTPMRDKKNASPTERSLSGHSLYELSYDHGLVPQLGFFLEDGNRLPIDYEEILELVGPRPVLVIAPQWDNEVDLPGVKALVENANRRGWSKDFSTYIELFSPMDYNRFSPEMKNYSCEWLLKQLNGDK